MRMRAFPTLGLGAAFVALVLLPLYGDPTPGSAVTHPEWARMVLRGLDLLEGGGASVTDTASRAFGVLSGRDSRAWRADRYVSSRAVEVVGEGDARRLRPTGPVGEAVYAMSVARPGDYRLRLHVAGPEPVEAEVSPMGSDEIVRSFAVPATPVMGWVDAGVVHLDPGAYDASVLLPPGAALNYVELAPPCLQPIEPPGGWKPTALTTTADVAVTVLEALDMEYELPPAATPLELHASDLLLEDGTPAVGGADRAFRSGSRGARVLLTTDIPEAGLYTLSVFGLTGSGERWLVDGCRTEVICPSVSAVPRWRVILSGQFGAGPHAFVATLGPDAMVERIRFERKKDAPGDYVGAIERLGLELGPEGPVTRDRAEEARRFLARRRAQEAAELCGDILAPGTLVAELASATGPAAGGGEGGGGTGGGTGGPGGGGGQQGGGGSLPPPVIPPLPPASPTLPVGFGG
jgi:uncharacterized membrane protein YgcG